MRGSRLLLLPALMLATAGCGRGPSGEPAPTVVPDVGPVSVGAEIGALYRARGFKSLWVTARKARPAARLLLRKVEEAALHGLDPAHYQPERLRRAIAASESPDAVVAARAELLISHTYDRFVRDLHRPSRTNILYVDEKVKPAESKAGAALERLARSEAFAAQAGADLALNPLYDRLSAGFAAYFRRWSGLPQHAVPGGSDLQPGARGERVRSLRRRLGLDGAVDLYDTELAGAVRAFEAVHGLQPDGIADAAALAALNRGYRHFERIIQANMDRARALAPGTSGRFVLVDTAGARLWLFEEGRVVHSMRVIVGKRGMATPQMAATIQYATLNPYWNVPPDLIRTSVASRVLKKGPGYARRERLQVLSDWSPSARLLDPARVNWRAVAAGRTLVQVRQLPGPGNMMGRMKFMFPNKLGIYLHDTPDKSLFARADRTISSGCVRVEDAERLARWLFRGRVPDASGAAEQRVDLPEPVPVYIVHLTALPSENGIRFQPDVYGRDRADAGRA